MQTAAVAAALLSAFFVAAAAPAKEGARARLTAALPVGAAPGMTVDVQWTVYVPEGGGGRQPFNANGMFVRLLSRSGASATIAFAAAGEHSDGRYAAVVRVPAGGIGGVRIGLRGTTDVLFLLENDPFRSRGGVRCDVAALRATLAAFANAYNRGDLPRLDGLFSRENFVWYSSGGPGVRRLSEASDRATLIPYFRRRHRFADRLSPLAFRFNGYEPQRELGHFEFSGRRRADDFRGGSWFELAGKGALDCSKPPLTIAVISLGGPPR
jgi:hypothetical protein